MSSAREPIPVSAEQTWKHWYDYLPRRLYMLRWYLLHGPAFWKGASFAAKVRGAYWTLLRGYDSEICSDCGRPVRLVFHVPDNLWEAVTGHARFPDGESAPGILCPHCVDDRFDGLLLWTCSRFDAVMVSATDDPGDLVRELWEQRERYRQQRDDYWDRWLTATKPPKNAVRTDLR